MPMKKVMEKFKRGTLHSGSKSGPVVTSRKQAIAIGMSYEKRHGEAQAWHGADRAVRRTRVIYAE